MDGHEIARTARSTNCRSAVGFGRWVLPLLKHQALGYATREEHQNLLD